MGDVRVRQESFADDLIADVYAMPDVAQTAAVIIVSGYPDLGFERITGCKFKDMGSTVSWARLFAASGMTAVAYTNREPERDARAILEHVRANLADRVAIFATSGNVPLALSLLVEPTAVDRAVLCYGYAFDADEQAQQFRFAYPIAGKSAADLAAIPMFLARAGRDEMPQLNASLDRFIAAALARNLPVTIANHPAGPHAFDLLDDCLDTSRIISQILGFMTS